MSNRAIGAVLLVAGVLLFLISATADSIGIGGSVGLGWKQGAGIIAGVVAAALGVVRLRSRKG